MVVAFPAPTGTGRVLSPDHPSFATEVRPWARLFRMSDEEFARRAISVREGWVSGRARVVAPLERYLSLLGAQQPWSMFSTPNRFPKNFVVEVRTAGGEWQFLSGLPSGAWRRSFFENERTRSWLNQIGAQELTPLFDSFCELVAGEALRDAKWQAARCRLQRAHAIDWRHPEPAPVEDLMEKVVAR
jgi:hypothetical protein